MIKKIFILLTLLNSFLIFTLFILPEHTRVSARTTGTSGVVTQHTESGSCTTLVGSPTLAPSQTLGQLKAQLGCSSANYSGTGPGGGGGSCQKAPNYPSKLAEALKDQFDITFQGFDQEHLTWFWEEMWSISATNFARLASGAIISSGYCPGSDIFSCQAGCNSGEINIYFGTYAGEEFNKVLITHELGHYIMCKNQEASVISLPQFDSAHAAEGGITEYGGGPGRSDAVTQACTGTTDVSSHNEDFAETVAYYLHPFNYAQSISCESGDPNPFYDYNTGTRLSSFPQHFAWAQKTFGPFTCSKQ